MPPRSISARTENRSGSAGASGGEFIQQVSARVRMISANPQVAPSIAETRLRALKGEAPAGVAQV